MFLLPLFTTVCVSIKLMTVPSLLISEMRGDEEENCDLLDWNVTKSRVYK